MGNGRICKLTGGLTLLTGALGVIRLEIKARAAGTGKRLDELPADLKVDNRALNEKPDRLVESLLAARQS